MRVLVTGGSGFIGRRLVRQLVARGDDVTILDRHPGGLDTIETDIRGEVRVVVGDTSAAAEVSEAMSGQDCVAHLAAGSSFLMYEERPVDEMVGATAGFWRVLDAAVRHDVRRVVHFSTSAVYEGNALPYHEDMPVNPPDLKALAKDFNERVAAQYEQRYGTEIVALRPFSVYGPGEVSKGPYANVVSLFAWAMASGHRPVLWGDGTQTRDFIYVDDVARAAALAIADSAVGPFNVGTGVETSFLDVIDLLNHRLGTALRPVQVEVPISVYATRLLADVSHSRDELGFVSEVTLSDGMTLVLDHFRTLPRSTREQLGGLQKQFMHGVPTPAITAGGRASAAT